MNETNFQAGEQVLVAPPPTITRCSGCPRNDTVCCNSTSLFSNTWFDIVAVVCAVVLMTFFFTYYCYVKFCRPVRSRNLQGPLPDDGGRRLDEPAEVIYVDLDAKVACIGEGFCSEEDVREKDSDGASDDAPSDHSGRSPPTKAACKSACHNLYNTLRNVPTVCLMPDKSLVLGKPSKPPRSMAAAAARGEGEAVPPAAAPQGQGVEDSREGVEMQPLNAAADAGGGAAGAPPAPDVGVLAEDGAVRYSGRTQGGGEPGAGAGNGEMSAPVEREEVVLEMGAEDDARAAPAVLTASAPAGDDARSHSSSEDGDWGPDVFYFYKLSLDPAEVNLPHESEGDNEESEDLTDRLPHDKVVVCELYNVKAEDRPSTSADVRDNPLSTSAEVCDDTPSSSAEVMANPGPAAPLGPEIPQR